MEFLVDDPATGGHPLHVARADLAAGARGIAMGQPALVDDGDGLEPAMRVLADAARARGRLDGLQSPVRVDSPLFYVHWVLRAGARVSLSAEHPERAVYVARGEVEIGGERVATGMMAVLKPGAAVTVTAVGDAVVMALGGEPVGPRYIDWNFVSSSPERIEQARSDWAAGRMKLPDLDDREFTPLPPKIGAAPQPMS